MRIILIPALALALVASACAGGGGGSGGGTDVVVGFYPLEEAVARVGGDEVDVQNLTPPGAEPHDLELTTDDVDAVESADLVIVLGHGFQPALERAASRRDGPTMVVLDELDVGGDDPHVWLDPQLMAAIVRLVAGALGEIDTKQKQDFDQAAGLYSQKLFTLSREMGAALSDCQRRTIVTAHEAFGRLADAYRLTQHGITGLSPEQEPDPARMAALADLVRREEITTIFTEKLVSPQVAQALAREAGVKVRTLNPLEGLTQREREAGADYVSVMRDNLRVLSRALACA